MSRRRLPAVLVAAGLVGLGPVRPSTTQPPEVRSWPSFAVRGTVVDPGGRPSAGARVVLIDNGDDPAVDWEDPQRHPGALVTTADTDGWFVFHDVPATTYWLWAGDAGGLACVRRIGFHDAAPPPEVLRLSGTVLEGEVLWADAVTPAAGVLVAAYGEDLFTRTDDAGRFRIPGIQAGDYTVVATARVPLTEAERSAIHDIAVAEYAESWRDRAEEDMVRRMEEASVQSDLTLAENETARLRLVLPGGVIEGVVTTPEGEPVAGARVSSGHLFVRSRSSFTDADGRFRLTHVPPGRGHVQVQGPNHEIRRVAVAVEPGGKPAHVEITLYPFSPQVVFHILDADGRPLAGQTLRKVYGQDLATEVGGLQTDEDGSCLDYWMVSGTKRGLVGSPAWGWAEQTVVVEPGVPETHVDVRLKRGATVTGMVRERGSGDPVGGVVLRPNRLDADGEYDRTTSLWNWLFSCIHCRLVSGYPVTQVSRDGDGTYRLTNLPPGEYRLGSRRLSIAGPETIEHFDLEVDEMPEKRWVTGRALAAGGEALVGAELTVIMDFGGPTAPLFGPLDGVPRRVLTDGAGRFRLGPFAPREYWLTAEIPGHRSTTRRVELDVDVLDAGDFLLSESEYTLAAKESH